MFCRQRIPFQRHAFIFILRRDPAENLAITAARIDAAVTEGAGFVLTPEVTNCVSASRSRQQAVLQQEKDDITLAGLRDLAARRGIWLSIGSLALKTGAADGRFAFLDDE